MPQHIFSPPTDGSMSPKVWYQTLSAQPEFVHDAAQAAAIDELDALWHELIEFKSRRNNFLGRSLLSPEVPKGLYVWGGVGRGKTFLMDAFYECVPYRRKRRIHFHNFMAEVHHELKLLAAKKDPLLALADNIAKSTRLLCFDEFHVSDIADAMILGRLLAALFERGVVLITTSNYPPDGLYPHGLQRQNFLPAIELLKRNLKVINVEGGSDYRLRAKLRAPLYLVPADAESEASMHAMFERLSAGMQQDQQQIEIQGRKIVVKNVSPAAVWFDFSAICGGPRAQDDYLEIAHKYPAVFLSGIPKMTAADAAEARRFTWLVDVFYDNNVKLVASAAALPAEIYTDGEQAGEFSRTASRLTEMQSRSYMELPHQSQNVTFDSA
jgi:cell division protein ZapE